MQKLSLLGAVDRPVFVSRKKIGRWHVVVIVRDLDTLEEVERWTELVVEPSAPANDVTVSGD